MSRSPCFEKLDLWLDPVPRDGPHNMAVDEWLLGTARIPMLRVYQWLDHWASLGCFVPIASAYTEFHGVNGMQFVRRWTGGGIVDHRGDWTYTLIVPASQVGALGRPRESYERVHQALANALSQELVGSHLVEPVDGRSGAEHGACFRNPVAGDLIDAAGIKQAGAAQRRTKCGLLHQGSVRIVASPDDPREPEIRSAERGLRLAEQLAASPNQILDPSLDAEQIQSLIQNRYGCREWLHSR